MDTTGKLSTAAGLYNTVGISTMFNAVASRRSRSKAVLVARTLGMVLVLNAGLPTSANAAQIIITTTTSWTVPSDWNNADNTIEVIGGGGGGGGAVGGQYGGGTGGGGGEYRKAVNVTLTPGASIPIVIGSGGQGGTAAPSNGSAGTATSFNGTMLVANPGQGGVVSGATILGGAAGGTGGLGGTVHFDGGPGGARLTATAGAATGGGGAAGRIGPGAAGGSTNGGLGPGGAGGGAANGGAAGGNLPSGNAGASGGNNISGSGGGLGGAAGIAGGAGSMGGGGGGGGGAANSPIGGGGAGGAGLSDWGTAGAGGGGGGGAAAGATTSGAGGTGGSYGGGGGGGGSSSQAGNAGGAGAPGALVITYTPVSISNPPGTGGGSPSSDTRVSSFAYDAATGLLTQEVVEPDRAALRLQTDYTYDSFGNRLTVTVSGADIATRSSASSFDANGQFNTGNTNALNQSESRQYDARFGTATSQTGPNGLATTWEYDSFGRKVREIRPDGTYTWWFYRLCNGLAGGTETCVAGASYLVAERPCAPNGTISGPTVTVYFDPLDREIARETQGFDGSAIRVATIYDALGRVAQTSRPYFVNGGTPQYTSFTYDALGRALTKTKPDGSVSQVAYHGLSVTKTNALGQTRATVRDSQGNIVSVTNALGKTITYAYDAFGNLTRTTDPSGNVSTATYDSRGAKIVDADPDMGSWSYSYNTLGLPVSQTDAKGQTVNLTYDKLDRVIQRVEPDKTSTWTYDTAAHGVGKLASTAITAGAGAGYSRSLSYDALSRATQVATIIDGATYNMSATYDANGQLSKVGYASGFTARYAYTSLGDVNQLFDDATGQVQWTANAMDAELRLTQQTTGNGLVTTNGFDALTGRLTSIATGSGGAVQNLSVTYDRRGNPLSRSDANTNLSETFTYDGLNRLLSSTVNLTPTPLSKTFSYDPIGNLLSKSDVGSYTYPAAGQAQPHAVTSISAGLISTTFTYDLNGNQTSGLGRTIAWTSYNKPASITQGARTISFVDDTEHQRFKQVTPEGTKLYLSAFGVSAEVSNPGTSSQIWTDYLSVGDITVGMRTVQAASETIATRYFHSDHLGSVAVITNEAGAVVERLSYDAWGKRRNPDGTDDTTASITSQSSRSFTGQEQLSVSGLVHLNGRVYDPIVARMTSADPTIPRPLSTQGWNRYAYAGNRPLKYVDPTGYRYCAVNEPGGNDEASGSACDVSGGAMSLGPTELPPITVYPSAPRNPGPPSVSYCWGCTNGVESGGGANVPGPVVIDLLGSGGGGASFGLWSWNSPGLNYFYGYYGGSGSVGAIANGASTVVQAGADRVVRFINQCLEMCGGISYFTGPNGLRFGVGALMELCGVACEPATQVSIGDVPGAAVLGVASAYGKVARNVGRTGGGLVDSSAIRFTQDSVKGVFRDGQTLQTMVDGLKSGSLSPSEIPPIRLFERDGNLFSLDNRRLLAAKLAGTPVNAIAATEKEIASSAYKFTTPNNGCIICLRSGYVNLER